jgi:hypothetical protein
MECAGRGKTKPELNISGFPCILRHSPQDSTGCGTLRSPRTIISQRRPSVKPICTDGVPRTETRARTGPAVATTAGPIAGIAARPATGQGTGPEAHQNPVHGYVRGHRQRAVRRAAQGAGHSTARRLHCTKDRRHERVKSPTEDLPRGPTKDIAKARAKKRPKTPSTAHAPANGPRHEPWLVPVTVTATVPVTVSATVPATVTATVPVTVPATVTATVPVMGARYSACHGDRHSTHHSAHCVWNLDSGDNAALDPGPPPKPASTSDVPRARSTPVRPLLLVVPGTQ